MQFDEGSERHRALFGRLGQYFESSLPPHGVLVEALADPSIDPQNIDRNFSISERIGSAGLLHRQGVEDLQQGVRFMLRHMATRVEFPDALASTGVLSHLAPALGNITKAVNLGSVLDVNGVGQALGVTQMTGPDGAAIRAAFGLGMTALSAMGPVGAAAAAILGFVGAIFGAFRNRKIKEAQDEKERQKAAFELMPPLQQPRDEVDEYYVQTVLMAIMETGSWTPMFAPRFDPRLDWVGEGRNGGFAFAPGEIVNGEDEFNQDIGVFKTSSGIGFIPGLNEITSVIQVSLDPFAPSVENWYDPVGTRKWPIKQAHVTDVGSFYVNTGRLAAVAWSWVAAQDASPDLYKVHVGTVDNPHEESLHYQWREYCAGGLRFVRAVADEFYSKDNSNKKIEDPEQRSYLFGMAIGCAIGAWRCYRHEGVWKQNEGSYGRIRFDMQRVYELDREYGCVAIPPNVVRGADGRSCFVTMYETNIRPTLEKVRDRQEYFLKHSLVCAYVRRSWDAFKDKRLRDLLEKMRTALLEHPDRRLVNLADVPREETHNGRNWYEQLKEAGAGKSRVIGTIATAPGRIDKPEGPAPTVPGDDAPMPFDPGRIGRFTITNPGGSRWRPVITAAGVAALVGAGAYGIHRYRRRQAGHG